MDQYRSRKDYAEFIALYNDGQLMDISSRIYAFYRKDHDRIMMMVSQMPIAV